MHIKDDVLLKKMLSYRLLMALVKVVTEILLECMTVADSVRLHT